MTTTSNTLPGAEELADQAAPLDALLIDAALGPLRRFAPDMSAAKFAAGLASRPRITGQRLGSLAAELARIGAGTSLLAPGKRDRRFTDPAWTENPLLRRIVRPTLPPGRPPASSSAMRRWTGETRNGSALPSTTSLRRCRPAMCRS
jgi:polyhydroxyalkanoate synthase